MSGLAEILARIPVEANQWFFQLGSVAIELLGAGTTAMDEHFCVTRPPLSPIYSATAARPSQARFVGAMRDFQAW